MEKLQGGDPGHPRGNAGHSVPAIIDLAKALHILIGGVTGSGKSVLMNSIITGLLFKFSPDELKFILIDPKGIEFSDFRDLPHLLTPIITDAHRATIALRWTVDEVEHRFKLMGEAGMKSIREYNDARGDDEKKLPRIVVIIGELADLMMTTETAREDIENSICRIAQIGRAAGVHLIVSTQRPSTNIITGRIKANFPTRIAFRVVQQPDSRVILDQPGAEKLLGMGDMLVRWPAGSSFERTQGAYIPDSDLKRLVAFVSKQAKPEPPSPVSEVPELELPLDLDNCDDESPTDPDIEHLLIVYRNQTGDEVKKQTANRKNKIGFNKADAPILTALAEKYLDRGELSPTELATVRRLIAKYWKQWS